MWCLTLRRLLASVCKIRGHVYCSTGLLFLLALMCLYAMLYVYHPKTCARRNMNKQLQVEMKVELCSFSNLSATCEWVVNATPRPLYPREWPGTHCTGGWVDPTAGLDGCEVKKQQLRKLWSNISVFFLLLLRSRPYIIIIIIIIIIISYFYARYLHLYSWNKPCS